MKKIRIALYSMILSLLLGTVISSGSMIALGGKLNSSAITGQPLSIPTRLVSCLDPLAILLEIAALFLIFRGRKAGSPLQQRTATAAVCCYLLWAAGNLFGFLPLAVLSTQNGSLSTALAGQWIKVSSALLAYAVPALLVFGLSQPAQRWLLLVGFFLTAVGSFGSVALTIQHMTLVPQEANGVLLYVASINVDYTQFPFPLLQIASFLGGLIYMSVYAWLAIQLRQPQKQAAAILSE
jgi:hypothetical protein